jgi:acyl-CoA synthetase (AMP-forming)/AMP-acid ligase II
MTLPALPRVSDYARAHAQRTPHGIALVNGDERITWTDLADRVDALARSLIAAGVVKGDRVGTLQTPRPEFMVAFLASVSIGAIWVGLNPRYRIEELAHVVEDSDPKVIIARTVIGARSYAEELARLGAGGRIMVGFDGEPALEGVTPMADFLAGGAAVSDAALTAAREDCGGRDPCVIVYTSGSTGKPKGAILHHEGVIGVSRLQNRTWPISPMVTLNYFPINHVGCLVDMSTPVLIAGGTMVMLEQFEPAASLALMQREGVTQWGSVPSVFQLQFDVPDFDSYDLSAVQMILWEGAAMPVEMIRRLAAIQPRMATNYSMTESTGAITVVAPTDDIDVLSASVGVAAEGVEVRLMDGQGVEVAEGLPGEVWTRAGYNFLGYWNKPEATAEAITPDGFFKTGDLAVRRPDGRYRIVGRLKEMYKSGGYNVYPREVETVLEAHPDVALAAVVAVPDPLWDEVGVAFVSGAPGLSAQALETWCKERLANYKAPKLVVVEAELPLLPIGKVDKVLLKRRAIELTTA